MVIRCIFFPPAKVNTPHNAAGGTSKQLNLKQAFDKPVKAGLTRRFQLRNQLISFDLQFFDQTFRHMNR
jgi:hypothetical protein